MVLPFLHSLQDESIVMPKQLSVYIGILILILYEMSVCSTYQVIRIFGFYFVNYNVPDTK